MITLALLLFHDMSPSLVLFWLRIVNPGSQIFGNSQSYSSSQQLLCQIQRKLRFTKLWWSHKSQHSWRLVRPAPFLWCLWAYQSTCWLQCPPVPQGPTPPNPMLHQLLVFPFPGSRSHRNLLLALSCSLPVCPLSWSSLLALSLSLLCLNFPCLPLAMFSQLLSLSALDSSRFLWLFSPLYLQ